MVGRPQPAAGPPDHDLPLVGAQGLQPGPVRGPQSGMEAVPGLLAQLLIGGALLDDVLGILERSRAAAHAGSSALRLSWAAIRRPAGLMSSR
eukprot:GAFH01000010.1.p4 GENE.GAFH01000010.1~~GAFH01000010.1.p4  ORF type:complete len:92 (+),score=8.53 GAFH01000010.1:305-580(+)